MVFPIGIDYSQQLLNIFGKYIYTVVHRGANESYPVGFGMFPDFLRSYFTYSEEVVEME
ncbi:MAG: hypothetical protein SVY10_06000 [Thermodesulfobacteriota bacterium]|nr:hypothetical protein [Thermodesulfobacteriota bacterium]